MLQDPRIHKAVGALAGHYPGTSSGRAHRVGIPHIWSGEDFSTDNRKSGAGCLARILNQNYVREALTKGYEGDFLGFPFGFSSGKI